MYYPFFDCLFIANIIFPIRFFSSGYQPFNIQPFVNRFPGIILATPFVHGVLFQTIILSTALIDEIDVLSLDTFLFLAGRIF